MDDEYPQYDEDGNWIDPRPPDELEAELRAASAASARLVSTGYRPVVLSYLERQVASEIGGCITALTDSRWDSVRQRECVIWQDWMKPEDFDAVRTMVQLIFETRWPGNGEKNGL